MNILDLNIICAGRPVDQSSIGVAKVLVIPPGLSSRQSFIHNLEQKLILSNRSSGYRGGMISNNNRAAES